MGLRVPAGYTEWAAPAALRSAVTCLWTRVGAADGEALVLPDACTDLIWQQGRGAFVAGPDTGPAPTRITGGTIIIGVRFRPSAGGSVLGLPLSELRDQRIDLADLSPARARRLPAELDPGTAAARILGLAADLAGREPPDPAVTRAATLLRDPRARTEDVAAEVGLSLRQLRRRCHAAVGYGPKTLQRILRFQRFISRIDRNPGDLAALAAETGYADQAHLTRECVRLAGLTPAALARHRGLVSAEDRGLPGDGPHWFPRLLGASCGRSFLRPEHLCHCFKALRRRGAATARQGGYESAEQACPVGDDPDLADRDDEAEQVKP
jgi:AraC-like DNA-binding protein